MLSSRLQQLILSAEVPADIADAIDSAAAEIVDPAADTTFALRSSALGEDSADMSFAGQYESLLNVRRSNLVAGYLEVVASKYTPQAMQYRRATRSSRRRCGHERGMSEDGRRPLRRRGLHGKPG